MTSFNPAFEAIVPSDCNYITDIANQLVQGMLTFNQNEFTLVCSDWTWSLGFTIAQLLEEKYKTISLVVLDSAAKRAPSSLIQNYISIMKFKFLRNLDEKISKVLQVLENWLDFMHLPMTSDKNKFKGFLHIVVPDSEETLDISEMQLHCEAPVRVHAIPFTDLSSLLTEKKTAYLVNSLVLFENKTAGRKIKKQYIDKSIVEHALKTKGSLQRSQ